MDEIVRDIGALIDAGKVRAWGVLNWQPALIVEAAKVAAAEGVEPPCAAQLPYSLAHRTVVEDEDMTKALDAAGASVVASFSLHGGALTGKYAAPGAKGRLARDLNEEFYQPALKAAGELRTLAERRGTGAAPMAIAFALLNPRVASVLFGATTPEQVVENVGAVEMVKAMDTDAIAELRRIGSNS
jgi:aryl-alcohol dehydrogenase-like predicted oxidoreductase